jgi:hypothetical protein
VNGRVPGKHGNSTSAIVMKSIAVAVLMSWLSGCTTQTLEAPKPALSEEPINSLALEQCIGENGQAKCTAGGE